MSLELVAPLDGLRVSFNLVVGDASRATYECAFLWTNKDTGESLKEASAQAATARANVQVNPPNVDFADASDVPDEALVFARGLLRTIARSIGETKWPRRITRWRDK